MDTPIANDVRAEPTGSPIVSTVAEIGRSVGLLAIVSAHASTMQAPMPAYFV